MSDELPSLYDEIGGAETLKALVDRFYKEMDENPEMKEVREMHPADLATSNEKLYMFLSGWTGGPNLYWEKYGHPRLRARHMPFPIGDREALQWLLCMDTALEEVVADEGQRQQLLGAFKHMAGHMRNRVTE